jgi:sodium transport system permease protein
MRWSVVRLISAREIRDQLRDRRTLFLILGLPILMYPLFVGVGILFVTAVKEKKLKIGVAGAQHLPPPRLDLTPVGGGPGETAQQMLTYPPLLENGQFGPRYAAESADSAPLTVKILDGTDDEALKKQYLDTPNLDERVDAIVVVEPDAAAKLQRGERVEIRVLGRDGEENSKIAVQRVNNLLRRWEADVKAVRFVRKGLPTDFDRPLEIRDPQSAKTEQKKITDELRDQLVKVIPFLLVMWMLTGVVYPAIDMTAGEKERGTMETLLISPAERTEIVAGKFIATACLGFSTAMWNVLLMVVAVAVAPHLAPNFFGSDLISLSGLAACILAAIPLAMLFAALALSLGIFARSTKEGNYYMVPLFFMVLPMAYWSMTPGNELDGRTSWIPLVNALLFQQRLMSVRPDPFPWQHVPAVFISLGVCVALALFAATRQFHRESVLFRESQSGGRRWSLFGKK